MLNLIDMWKHPRMVAWFVAAMVLFFLARLPFFMAPLLPGYVEFMPGIVLVPLFGVFWGPAGALGITVASVCGDLLLGFHGWGILYRAVGMFFCAISAKKLWDYVSSFDRNHKMLAPTLRQTFRFLAISLPGIVLAAAWNAFGIHATRAYPFAFALLLLLLNHLVFLIVLGPVLFRGLAKELVPHFGCWRTVMKDKALFPSIGLPGVLLTLVGSFGAAFAGYWMDELFRSVSHPFHAMLEGEWPLGSYAGITVTLWVLPLLLVQVAGLLLPRRRKTTRLEELGLAGAVLVLALPLGLPAQDFPEPSEEDLDQVLYMHRPPKLPDADELLSEVRHTLPAIPLELEAELVSRTSGGKPANAYKAQIFLHWHPFHPQARYLITDAFGKNLHRLEVETDDTGKLDYSYETGDPLKPAVLESLHREIEDTNFTWLDLAFAYLWWPNGKTVGAEEVKERFCYIVDLPAPDPETAGIQGVRLWIEPKVHVMMRAAVYGADGEPLRQLDVKSLKKIDGIWSVKDVEVKNLQTKTRTRLRIHAIKDLREPEQEDPEHGES